MVFAMLMLAAAVAATLLIGLFVGVFWGVLAFAVLAVLTYRAVTDQRGPNRPLRRDELSAFQRPLGED